MTLLLALGGWCTSVYAAWDLTNVVPITKSSELKDGMYVYFRGQCNASAAEMVLGADFSYTGFEVSEKHLFKLVDAGKSVDGYQMYYTQNVDNEKWFSGSTNGWTVDNMDESTPLAIAEASKWTCMERKCRTTRLKTARICCRNGMRPAVTRCYLILMCFLMKIKYRIGNGAFTE